MYIIKYADGNFSTKYHSNEAFEKALKLNVDIVNFSAGGTGSSIFEWDILKKMSFKNIIVVVSAGNQGLDLDQNCTYYPACYKLSNVVTVGSINSNNKRSTFSNYGKVVTISYYGEKQNYGGLTLTGTSQSTAHITGLLAKQLYKTGTLK
jgi:subtilisin family serine protease